MSQSPFVEIVDFYTDAIKDQAGNLVAGDVLFDVAGDRHTLTKVSQRKNDVRTVRDDGVTDEWDKDFILTRVKRPGE